MPLADMSIFVAVLHGFDYCSFIVGFEIRKCESSNCVLLFQGCFAYSRSLTVQKKSSQNSHNCLCLKRPSCKIGSWLEIGFLIREAHCA